MNLKKMLVGAVAVASAVALTGCGSASDMTSSQSASLTKATFASAITKATKQTRSVHMVVHMSMYGQRATMTGDLATAHPARTRTESLAQAMRDVSMSMSVSMPGGRSAQMRMVNGAVYVSTAGLGLDRLSGKPWAKFDATDPKGPMGSLFSSVGSMDSSQLAQAFHQLASLTKVGTQTVDGVRATHYRATVQTAKVAALMGLSGKAGLSALPKTLTYDVWLDQSMRLVEMETTVQGMRTDVHFSRWNEPVHIVAPPASQVKTIQQR